MALSLSLTQRPVRHAALELRTAAKSTTELQATIRELKKANEESPEVFIGAARMAVENVDTVRSLMRLLIQLSMALAPFHGGDASRALGDLINTRDKSVGAHHRGVESAAVRLAAQLELDQATTTRIARSARVFDVGKLFVPIEVLHGDGPLDRESWPVMQRHVTDSCSIVASIPSLAPLAQVLRAHHERPDGHGYPDGLRGEEIPVEAHVLSIADTWVSVVSARPYRPAMSVNEAILMLKDGRGRQWDADAVDGLLEFVAPRQRDVGRVVTSLLGRSLR
jgi:HD-GYP domain-containing protein (c-di-GMP phosphodiesterase class II)